MHAADKPGGLAADAHVSPIYMMKLRPGIELIEEKVGSGDPAKTNTRIMYRLRMWLNHGDEVKSPGGNVHQDILNRSHQFSGLYYTLRGMQVGGIRRVRISPHMAYGEAGIENEIPANAVLVVEVELLRLNKV